MALAVLLARPAAAQEASDPVAPLDLAVARAEASLQKGQVQAAEGHYREALFEGWLLVGSLDRLAGRDDEARQAFRQAAAFTGDSAPAVRALASGLLQLGDHAQAAELLASLAARDSGDVETRRLLAKALAAGGQRDQALQTLDEAQALTRDPEQEFLLGAEYLWLKRPEAAEPLFARVARARPLAQTHVLIGRTYRDAGEYARARQELETALKMDPRVRRAHYYLGMVAIADARTAEERLDRAIAEFQAELKLDPRDALANDQLGLALLEAGRAAEALPAFERAVSAEGRSLYVSHLGRCQLALDRPADAVASLRKAVELGRRQGAAPSDLEKTHYHLGLALRKTGAGDEAATHLEESRRLAALGTGAVGDDGAGVMVRPAESSPLTALGEEGRAAVRGRAREGLGRAYLNLGVMEAQGKRFERAVELLEKARELSPGLAGIDQALGVSSFNVGQYRKASEALTRAVAAAPGDAGLKRMLGMASLETRDYAKAVELLGQDPELGTNRSLQFAYGLALVRSGRAAEAEGVFSGLVKGQGDSAELSVLLGQAHAQQGDYDSAIAALTRAWQLKEGVAEAQATLGEIYLKQGRLEEAERALKEELKWHPDDAASQQNLAVVLESLQRRVEAIGVLRGLLGKKPELGDARYLLGKMLLSEGKAEEAVGELEEAARLSPEAPNVRYQLGQAYQKLGRSEQAQRQFDLFRQLKDQSQGRKP